jgi:hypothetical protein
VLHFRITDHVIPPLRHCAVYIHEEPVLDSPKVWVPELDNYGGRPWRQINSKLQFLDVMGLDYNSTIRIYAHPKDTTRSMAIPHDLIRHKNANWKTWCDTDETKLPKMSPNWDALPGVRGDSLRNLRGDEDKD